MTAVRVALGVRVVLHEVGAAVVAVGLERGLRTGEQIREDRIAGGVLRDEVVQPVAFGRRVLRVGADVEVEPRPVRQEDVGGATPLHDRTEQVPRDLLRAQAAGIPRGEGDPVFGLQAVDALHASPSSRRKVRWKSDERSSSAASTPVSAASPMASRPVC